MSLIFIFHSCEKEKYLIPQKNEATISSREFDDSSLYLENRSLNELEEIETFIAKILAYKIERDEEF